MDKAICSVEGCEKPHLARGWCEHHYGRWYRNGDPLAGRAYRSEICQVDGCADEVRSRNWCSRHYARYLRHGTPEVDLRKVQRKCWGPECDRMTSANQGSGLCSAHREQMRRRGWLSVVRKPNRELKRPYMMCSFSGCDRVQVARGFCRPHDKQDQSGQQLTPIPRRPRVAPPCGLEGCEKKSHMNGLCSSHWSLHIARWNRYGISAERGREIWISQSMACAICRTPLDITELVIDHDHSCCPTPQSDCGRCVRGLLCRSCNGGAGKFKDDPALLRAAADYIEAATPRSLR